MEAGPKAEFFVNANGSDRSELSAAVECLRPAQSTGRFWPRRATARTTLNKGRRKTGGNALPNPSGCRRTACGLAWGYGA